MTYPDPPDPPPDPHSDPSDPMNKLRVIKPNELPPEPRLHLNKWGNPRKNAANVIDLLSRHEAWEGVLGYDAFRETIVKRTLPPVRPQDQSDDVQLGEWTEADTMRAITWMSSRPTYHRIEPERRLVESALEVAARRNTFHPVREWLDSLTWDGQVRLPGLWPRYFAAIDSPFTREVGVRWMISAVARVYRPGCQAKYMPVLESPQDAGKSTGLQALAGCLPDGSPLYSDTTFRPGEKDSYQAIRQSLIHELAELAAFRTVASIEGLKGFLSSTCDLYRAPYARRHRSYPRQCVFVGTTNDDRWITDPTGGSRFWPIRCDHARLVDRAALERDRDQLWAEARVRFEGGEIWWISDPAILAHARDEQHQRLERDPWIARVESWLSDPLVPAGGGAFERIVLGDGVTTSDVLTGGLGMRPSDMGHGHAMRVGRVLGELGWVRRQVRVGRRREYRYFPPEGTEDPHRPGLPFEGDGE